MQERASALGCDSRLYAVQCSEQTARRRCAARNRNLSGSLVLTETTFDTLKARFEPLAADEQFTLVTTE